MIIKTKMTEYPCFRAEQHKENIHLFNESGKCLAVLVNPTVREVVDGEIEVIESVTQTTDAERIAQLEEALDMLLSGVTE